MASILLSLMAGRAAGKCRRTAHSTAMRVRRLLAAVLASALWFGLIGPVFSQDWRLTSAPQDALYDGLASSADGVKLVAVAWPYIYSSTNSGGTWSTNRALGQQQWSAVASSADGTRLILSGYGTPLYTSTDSGATWVSNAISGNRVTSGGPQSWSAVASSADGNTLVAAVSYGLLFTSTNGGATWSSNSDMFAPWQSVAS